MTQYPKHVCIRLWSRHVRGGPEGVRGVIAYTTRPVVRLSVCVVEQRAME
jgi:hypothetical protein